MSRKSCSIETPATLAAAFSCDTIHDVVIVGCGAHLGADFDMSYSPDEIGYWLCTPHPSGVKWRIVLLASDGRKEGAMKKFSSERLKSQYGCDELDDASQMPRSETCLIRVQRYG